MEQSQKSDSSTVTSTMQEEFDDITWSIYSNTFFVTGCFFYLLATIWDYVLFRSDPSVSIDNVMSTRQRLWYELLWCMGPVTYLLNSVIDVRWALKIRERDRRKRQLKKLMGRFGERTCDIGERQLHPYQKMSDEATLSPFQTEQTSHIQRNHKQRGQHNNTLIPPTNLLHRMRKHMGHRRELAAALTFGIASALSVLGGIFYLISFGGTYIFRLESAGSTSQAAVNSNVLTGWAVHMFLVHAIFALWRNPFRQSKNVDVADAHSNSLRALDRNAGDSLWIQSIMALQVSQLFNNLDSLETLGDIFFGLASVIDVFLQDSSLDDNLIWCPIVSALLCMTDSLLYLRGDFIALYLRKETLTDDHNRDSSEPIFKKVWEYPEEIKSHDEVWD